MWLFGDIWLLYYKRKKSQKKEPLWIKVAGPGAVRGAEPSK